MKIYTYINIYTHMYIYSFSHIIFCHVPLQVTRYSSLCHTAGYHCLSIPGAIVCIYQPQTPNTSHSFLLPLGNHKSVLHVHEFFFFSCALNIFRCEMIILQILRFLYGFHCHFHLFLVVF